MLSGQYQEFLRTNILFSEFTESEFLQISRMTAVSGIVDQTVHF